tara:strand:- start:9731 stop:10465 length:735 start_codon:yes stop_codon:yes gene_type:complete
MEEYIPAIQDRLRGNSFPRFQEVRGQQVVFGPTPKVTAIQQWVFSNRDRTWSVILAPDFVVLETSTYGKFEEFIETLEGVLSVVGEEARVDFSERLGLRYVDLIRPEKTGGTYHQYLKRSLHGLDTSDFSDGEALHRFETRVATKTGGTLVVKVSHAMNGGFLPPDIDGNHLDFSRVEKVGAEERVVLLDIDHFSDESMDFNSAKLVEEMWNLHGDTRKAFEHSVTPYAIEQWKPAGPWNVKED